MPILISILCCLQILGGLSLLIVAVHSYKTLQLSAEKMNGITTGMFEKIKQKYYENNNDGKKLSAEELEELKGFLKYFGENVRLQITMSFLSLYFIGSRIIMKPAIPMFSTVIFAIINMVCGVMLIQGGAEGWYLGVFACVYALLRNLHALVLVPKLAKKISHNMFKVKQFYIKYTIRCCSLLIVILYFFDNQILHYFSVEHTTLDTLMVVELAAIGFILLDYCCYKMQEWTAKGTFSS